MSDQVLPAEYARQPIETRGALLQALDALKECVDAWSVDWRAADTIAHPGKVTFKMLEQQAGRAPRSIVSVQAGRSQRLSAGKQMQTAVVFAWYIVCDGTLEDRARLGANLSGEAVRLVGASPWSNPDDSCFSSLPEDRIQFRSLYQDEDEQTGLSIWVTEWTQTVDLGSARRPPEPLGDPLERIDGTIEIPGEPNPSTVETEIPIP